MSASFRVSETRKLEIFFWLPRKLETFSQLPFFKSLSCATGALMAKFSPHEIRSIAVAAMVDPRSVRKVLDGRPLHALTFERIKNALAQLNRLDLLPATTSAAEPPAAA